MTRRSIAYWLCQIIGWGIYTAIGVSIAASQVGWKTSLLVACAIFFLGILLLTHLLRGQIRKRQWLSLLLRRSAPRLAGAAILFGLISTL